MTPPALLGHDAVLKQLRAGLRRGRLGHAFLFVGPDGVGKRRTALHLAQSLLCELHPAERLDPCRTCDACRQVQAGAHPDLHLVGKPPDKNEMPIGVVQELCARLSVKSARTGRKVAVVDDADGFNEESANAFLKTLEEPPPGTTLVLLATSVETQLPTILSRCQLLRFAPLHDAVVARLLVELAAVPDLAVAERLAASAEGSIGWALELAKPDWEEARRVLREGLTEPALKPASLADALHEFIESAGKEAAAKRLRGRQLVRLAAELFREVLHCQHPPPPPPDDAATGAWRPAVDGRIAGMAVRTDPDVVVDLLERCLQADFHLARYLNQTLAVDCWIDDLAQITAGRYAPPVGVAL
ncbi:MAG: DNA polymerase III subunit delta' [Planctomycetia bacterium]